MNDNTRLESGSDKIASNHFHDSMNMINAVIGSLNILQRKNNLDNMSTKLLSNAINSAQNLHKHLSKDTLKRHIDVDKAKNISEHNDYIGTAPFEVQKDLFFSAIEMTRMPMVVTNPLLPDNPIVFANQAFSNTTGYDLEEVIGHNCKFLQGENTSAETVQKISKALYNRTDISVEILNYRKDGSTFWNALYLSPIFDQNNELLYFFGSQLDVTRRKEAENALRKAQKLEAIGQLTGGIAHDFNNLLQVIIGNLQISKITEERSKTLYHMDLASQAASKACVLTQQLLAFSRKQPLDARVVNVNRVITDLQSILKNTLGETRTFTLDLEENIGNIEIDTVQLEMALINVVVNARDAMPHEGSLTISTSAYICNESSDLPYRKYVKIDITDTGSGMTKEVLDSATEPFFTTKDIGKGTGLGLPQVYGFTKQSEGQFSIESTVGQGTKISLCFPAVDQTLSRDQVKDSQEIYKSNGETILLVEDNKEVHVLAKTILEAFEYKVICAENARTALNTLENKKHEIDLLFTDIIMPGSMNGVSLAKQIRTLYPKTGILLTTGFAEDLHGHTNTNEFEIIYKPYMPDELLKKIHDVLKRRLDHGN